jgi:hypothetical protein
VPDGDGFLATDLTIGPWDPGLQHAGPVAALLAREAERATGIPDGQTVRLAFDILAPVPVGPVQVSAPAAAARTADRAGRGGAHRGRRAAADAADRLAAADLAVEGTPEAGVPLPGPERAARRRRRSSPPTSPTTAR